MKSKRVAKALRRYQMHKEVSQEAILRAWSTVVSITQKCRRLHIAGGGEKCYRVPGVDFQFYQTSQQSVYPYEPCSIDFSSHVEACLVVYS